MKCSHCQLEYEKSALKVVKTEQNEVLHFCCKGCESVYFLLKNSGLVSFYDKLGGVKLAPPKENRDQDLAYFDSEGFAKKYIKILGDAKDSPTDSTKDSTIDSNATNAESKADSNICELNLVITGIHCAACVWLCEKSLENLDGVKSAALNYTNNKARVVFCADKIRPSQIIAALRNIGYNAHAFDAALNDAHTAAATRAHYTRLVVAIFATMNVMWVAVAQYLGYFLGMEAATKDLFNAAAFALATPVVFYSGSVFWKSAWAGLKNGFIGMDLLVCVGVFITYCYSIFAALTHAGETYFESVAMILTFVLVGKFLEQRARKKAGDGLDALANFLPDSVCVVGKNGELSIKSVEGVRIGDLIQALPGEKIAIDGVLESRAALLDMSAITGEHAPVEVAQNALVTSGATNLNAPIIYRATASFTESLMSRLIALVSAAGASKPRIQNVANAISQRFSRVVLSIAVLTFLGWVYIGGASAEGALVIAVSVIIIACPCALALATPIASVVGISAAYSRGVLFKKGEFIETLAKVSIVALDKTGTLTEGAPKVARAWEFGVGVKSFGAESGRDFGAFEVDLGADSKHLRQILSAFVALSKHPISQGVGKFLGDLSKELGADSKIENFAQIDAKGIVGEVGGVKILGGSKAFLQSCGVDFSAFDVLGSNAEGSFFGFAICGKMGGILCAAFELEDAIKADARELIEYFKAHKIRPVILSGDNEKCVKKVASALGISEFYAAKNPLEKAQIVESLRQNGAVVAMAGDGINDALALKKASVAFGMGGGSAVAVDSSDVVLLDNSLSALKFAFEIARKTLKTIKQNIAFSIAYNALSIPLAIAGFIIPLFAALSMSFSSIVVVLNSLRIRKSV